MDSVLENDLSSSYHHVLQRDGVIKINNAISASHIPILIQEINIIRALVMKKISGMERPIKTYTDIAERQLNRLDYRCGFTANIFDVVAKPILQMIKAISPTIDFRYYWGAIPSLPGSGPTDMHRDVYPFLNTAQGNNLDHHDIQLPPYYLTAFIPLVSITKENGPTEFVKGSHLHSCVDENEVEIYAPHLEPSDLIIFDGRTLHRGTPNQSQKEKLIAYITFAANWYHDQTFKINDYLFPELATPGC